MSQIDIFFFSWTIATVLNQEESVRGQLNKINVLQLSAN